MQERPFSPFVFNMIVEALATREKNKYIKAIDTGKEEVKSSQFAEDMILEKERPKDSAGKDIKINSEFCDVTACEITEI